VTARQQERHAEVTGTTTTPDERPAPLTRLRTAAGTISRVLVLWGIGRAINLMILWSWYQLSKAYGWGFGPDREHVTTFLNFLSDWDGARYGRISQVGYPTWLPMDPSGVVQPSDWAFLPVYPALERGMSEVFGIPWQASGVAISILASAGATVLLYVLLRRVTSARASWWATVMFTIGPLSFIFVLAYAESLVLMLTFACLLLAVNRKYFWIVPVGVLASFVRPGLLALSLGLGLVFLARWVRRERDPFPIRERWGIIAAGLSLAVAGLAWSQIATMVTGTKDAYVRTETAWWIPFIGEGHFVPLTPWFRLAGTWLGIGGIVIVLALAGLFIAWMRSKQARALGLEVWTYSASYLLYLFAVFLPQQSTFRLLMPIAPMFADERFSSTPKRRQMIVVGCIVLQIAAVLLLWTIGWP
jgi:hypothetical protein